METGQEEGEKGTVLVVDDSMTNRVLLRTMLERAGYKVAECADGRECLEVCEDDVPSVVLLDVMMPHVSGIDVCRKLREQYSKDELPIMMVTTKGEGVDVREGMEAGANDYVTKPVDRVSFLARVDSLISWSETHRKIEQQQETIVRNLEIQRAMGDLLPEALVVSDHEGQILYCNKPFISFCDDVQPRNIFEALHVIFDGALTEYHSGLSADLFKDDTTIIDDEIEVRSGAHTNVRIRSMPVELAEEAGNARLRLWLWHDLTRVRDLERRINQQVKLEAVSLFAAGVAHNFNNLMGSILGSSEILKRILKDDERGQRYLTVIDRAIGAGRNLTRKMSTLVRRDIDVDRDKLETVREVVDVVIATQREANQKDIEFQIDIPEDLPLVNMAAANLLTIISNVIVNAEDAILGQGTISIVGRVFANGEAVELLIRDTGTGMEKDVLDRVYEPFFSTKNLDEENGVSMVGNGLGLWNVYNLLKSSGGDVMMTSEPAVGTEVRLQFPVLPKKSD